MNIIIVGGGTAGYLAAYELQTLDFIESILLIEDEELGIIGTGEGSTGLFTYFVDKVGEKEFLEKTSSTYKLGVYYKNWGNNFLAPIDTPPVENKLELYESNYSIKETHINAFLMEHEYDPYTTISGKEWKTASSVAYHFDGHEVGQFFRSKCNAKVTIINDSIKTIVSNNNKIEKIISKSGNEYSGDYYTDCTGFARIFGKHFDLEWDDYSDYLLIDSAMPFQLPVSIRNYTTAQAMDYGWCWEIPKRNNLGCGYNFSSKFISNERALEECKKIYGDITPIKFIKYQPGSYKTTMGENWNIIGIAGGFLEPLEATTIHTSILNIFSMIDVLTNSQSIDLHNELSYEMSQDMRDFIQLHYFCERNDTDFWKTFYNHEIKLSEKQKIQLNLIKNNKLESAFKFIGYDLLYPMLKGMNKTNTKINKPKNEVLTYIEMFKKMGYFKPYE